MIGWAFATILTPSGDNRGDVFYTAETFCGGTGIPSTNDPSVPAHHPHFAGGVPSTQEAMPE
ncbi:MAG: hypothetical protein Tsb0013_21650 [Phycisphaerales bacterium]